MPCDTCLLLSVVNIRGLPLSTRLFYFLDLIYMDLQPLPYIPCIIYWDWSVCIYVCICIYVFMCVCVCVCVCMCVCVCVCIVCMFACLWVCEYVCIWTDCRIGFYGAIPCWSVSTLLLLLARNTRCMGDMSFSQRSLSGGSSCITTGTEGKQGFILSYRYSPFPCSTVGHPAECFPYEMASLLLCSKYI